MNVDKYAELLRNLAYDAAERCDDVCNANADADRVSLLDDAILLLSTAIADARCMRDTILESMD